MNEQDRELLVIDLCGRVPYEVIVCIDGTTNVNLASVSYWEEVEVQDGSRCLYDISDIKPYLFPLSSMTEEQKIECFKGTDIELDEHNEIWSTFPISKSDIVLTNLNNWLKVINWLNKNHFDYRGLIPMGLAIDCTNLNIY